MTCGTDVPTSARNFGSVQGPLRRLLVIGCAAPSVLHLPALVTHLRVTWDLEVAVALTAAAQRLTTPAAVSAVTGQPVVPAQWADAPQSGPVHVTWAAWPDLVVVWPATLHFLAKCATGLGDDVPSAIVLATQAPVMLAPSVAPGAFTGGPFARAVKTLKADGRHILGPQRGLSMSDLQEHDGGCVSPEQLVRDMAQFWSQQMAGA